MTYITILTLAGLIVIGLTAAHHARRRGEARQEPEQESLGSDPGGVPPCVICGEPSWMQLPHLAERRGLLDAPLLDGLWRRLGVRREVQLVLVLERPIDVPTNVCPSCHRITRARCEQYLCEVQGRRATAAVDEAGAVADFLAFGMLDFARAAVVEKVKRLRKQALQAQQRPASPDGSA